MRDAAETIGSGTEEIVRWYRELEHYGFIVQVSGGCLGVDGEGFAPHWRLTELGYMLPMSPVRAALGIAQSFRLTPQNVIAKSL
jgi:hypothetical protein